MRINLKSLSDDELIASLKRLIADDRRHLVAMLRHLREMDRRRLAERRSFPSLFEYCVRELRLAEGDAIRRIRVSRLCARFPTIYGSLERGLLTLATAALLEPHLTRTNRRKLLHAAWGRRTREVEALVAEIAPQVEPPERARFLGIAAATEPPRKDLLAGTDTAVQPEASPPPASGMQALQPEPLTASQRVHFSFTSDERFLAAVERAKELLMNKYGAAGFEAVFREAVSALLEKIDPELRRAAARTRVPPAGDPEGRRRRTPPAWVKRTVWARDSGYCAFRAPDGTRCRSKAGLQYDHLVPWALGGRSDDPSNIRLLCRAHNRLEARLALGHEAVDRLGGRSDDPSAAAAKPESRSGP